MNSRRHNLSERGQIMMGFYIALIAIMGMVLIAMNYFDVLRKDAQQSYYRDIALDAAKRGFDDALSFYRRNPNGVAVSQSNKPANQNWVSPWPYWPDDGFQPQAGDTDYYVPISTASGALCSAAIIRDYPVNFARVSPAAGETSKSVIWARYVVKRQGVRNWSPGGNTFSVFTDPEAAHDVSAYRDFSNSSNLGAGNYWSIVSRGYAYAATPSAQSMTYTGDVNWPASTVLNTLTSTPCAKLPCNSDGGRKLLLASAKVYGELYRITFMNPQAALFVPLGTQVTGNVKGVINGTSSYTAVASSNGSCPSGGQTLSGAVQCGSWAVAPSVSGVFPGLDKAKLQATSQKVMNTTNYIGDQNVLPDYNSLQFTENVARVAFYYLKKTGAGLSGPAGTFQFNPSGPNSNYRFQGSGLCFVDGNLSITAQTIASWSGIVFVDGNAYINGPSEFYGTLIVTGSTCYVGGSVNKAFIEYSDDAVNTVKNFLQDFRVDKPSVVTSFN